MNAIQFNIIHKWRDLSRECLIMHNDVYLHKCFEVIDE